MWGNNIFGDELRLIWDQARTMLSNWKIMQASNVNHAYTLKFLLAIWKEKEKENLFLFSNIFDLIQT